MSIARLTTRRSAVAIRALQRLLGGGSRAAGIAGVRRAERLDQQHVGLVVGSRAVLDAARDDEQAAFGQLDVAIASGIELADHGLFYPLLGPAAQRARYMTAFPAPSAVWERLARAGRCAT
jgi:hypothetical protein